MSLYAGLFIWVLVLLFVRITYKTGCGPGVWIIKPKDREDVHPAVRLVCIAFGLPGLAVVLDVLGQFASFLGHSIVEPFVRLYHLLS